VYRLHYFIINEACLWPRLFLYHPSLRTPKRDNMRQAVRQVLIGDNGVKLSLRKAAQENGVSFQTLQRYVKKTRCNIDAIGESSMKSNYKHRLVFNENQENELASYVIKCSKMCYGRTTKDTRNLAYEMAHLNSIKIPANWHRTKMAGIDWLYGFLKRHPNLSIRATWRLQPFKSIIF